MKKSRKAGLLIVTLVIPALVFTFLRFFASNHYDLPYYHPLMDSSGRVIVRGGDTLFKQVLRLNLNKTTGTDVITAEFNNRFTVVSYLPEECSDTCALVLSQLERIAELRKEIPKLTILTLAENDVAKPVKSDSVGWRVLHAEHESIERSLNELYFQTVIPKRKAGSLESKLALIDKEGFIRGYYDGSDATETDRLMAEIKILDYEEKIEKRL